MAVMPIVKEALKLLRSSTPATIEIRQHFTARHDVVIADPTQIHQVLMNLCTNAVHCHAGQRRNPGSGLSGSGNFPRRKRHTALI